MIVGIIKSFCKSRVKNISIVKLQLINFDKFAGFSNGQIKMISFLQRITKDIIMCYKSFFLSSLNYYRKEEARQYMLDDGNSYHERILCDFQSVWKSTLLL